MVMLMRGGQMLPRQGEMGKNIPFTRKCTKEPSQTLERVRTMAFFARFYLLHNCTYEHEQSKVEQSMSKMPDHGP